MDEHQLRVRGRRPLEELERGGDAGHQLADLGTADDLESGRSVLRPLRDLEELVRVADDLVAVRHAGDSREPPSPPPETARA
jgi:hypothetical protein